MSHWPSNGFASGAFCGQQLSIYNLGHREVTLDDAEEIGAAGPYIPNAEHGGIAELLLNPRIEVLDHGDAKILWINGPSDCLQAGSHPERSKVLEMHRELRCRREAQTES